MVSNRITKNFVSLLLSNIVGQLFVLWAIVHVASVFGPEGFGRFAFAQVVALHFLYLGDFGLQTLGTRTIAQEKGGIAAHVWDISVLRIVLAGLCFLLLIIVSAYLPDGTQPLISIFGLTLLPSAVLFEWVFLGKEQMEIVGIGRILKGMVFAGLVFLFVETPDQLNYAAAFYVAGIVAATCVLFGFYLNRFGFFWGKVKYSALKSIFVGAIPLAAGSLLVQINFNFGTLAMGLYMTDDLVGMFSAAYKIVVFLLAFVVVAAANAIFPVMARAYKNSTGEFNDAIKRFLRLFSLLAVPVGVGGSILASHIMAFLYPPAYQEAVIVLQLSIWVVVIAIYRVTLENALIASRNRRHYFIGHIAAGTSTVVGNLLLVPVFGLLAPAMVGILSESLLLIYFVASCKYVRSLHIVKSTLKPSMAALLMGFTVLYLPFGLFGLLGAGVVSYIAFLVFFGGVTIDEIGGYVHSILHRGAA